MNKPEAVDLLKQFATAVAEWQYAADKGKSAKGKKTEAERAARKAFAALTGEAADSGQCADILSRCGLL